jgi:hypothetical protein
LWCAVIGFPAAYVLAKVLKGRAREAIFLLVILPFWSNGLVRVFSWAMVLRDGGILDAGLNAVLPFRINIDLMYGLPHQTEAGVVASVLGGVALRATRIAGFGVSPVQDLGEPPVLNIGEVFEHAAQGHRRWPQRCRQPGRLQALALPFHRRAQELEEPQQSVGLIASKWRFRPAILVQFGHGRRVYPPGGVAGTNRQR